MSGTLAELRDVLRTVFDDDDLALTRATVADDVDGWDSMMTINVMIAVERRFGVRFAAAEMANLKADGATIGTLVDLIDRKAGRMVPGPEERA